ncbi:hypothetical protein, partial [uncultured Bacteroides sp.]|uniref:hypothetical protein n=1 Tax=uncultured Bacteroides sp. TaxID=162156 RepID=UPI002607CE04
CFSMKKQYLRGYLLLLFTIFAAFFLNNQERMRSLHLRMRCIGKDRLKEMLGGGTLINIHVEPKK